MTGFFDWVKPRLTIPIAAFVALFMLAVVPAAQADIERPPDYTGPPAASPPWYGVTVDECHDPSIVMQPGNVAYPGIPTNTGNACKFKLKTDQLPLTPGDTWTNDQTLPVIVNCEAELEIYVWSNGQTRIDVVDLDDPINPVGPPIFDCSTVSVNDLPWQNLICAWDNGVDQIQFWDEVWVDFTTPLGQAQGYVYARLFGAQSGTRGGKMLVDSARLLDDVGQSGNFLDGDFYLTDPPSGPAFAAHIDYSNDCGWVGTP